PSKGIRSKDIRLGSTLFCESRIRNRLSAGIGQSTNRQSRIHSSPTCKQLIINILTCNLSKMLDGLRPSRLRFVRFGGTSRTLIQLPWVDEMGKIKGALGNGATR